MATKHKRWGNPVKRTEQSKRMTNNMNSRWAEVSRNPAKRLEEISWRTSHSQHPLTQWRMSEGVVLTQEMLAERIGVYKDTIANWESGRSLPRGKNKAKLLTLAEELKIPLPMDWMSSPQIAGNPA